MLITMLCFEIQRWLKHGPVSQEFTDYASREEGNPHHLCNIM